MASLCEFQLGNEKTAKLQNRREQNRSGKRARNVTNKKIGSKKWSIKEQEKGQGENTRKKQNELFIEHTSGKEEGKREDYISGHEQGERGENTRQRIEWTINKTNRKRIGQERGSYFQMKQGGQGENTRQRKTDYK